MFVVETSWAYSIYPGVETPGYMLKALSGLFKKKYPMQRALALHLERVGVRFTEPLTVINVIERVKRRGDLAIHLPSNQIGYAELVLRPRLPSFARNDVS